MFTNQRQAGQMWPCQENRGTNLKLLVSFASQTILQKAHTHTSWANINCHIFFNRNSVLMGHRLEQQIHSTKRQLQSPEVVWDKKKTTFKKELSISICTKCVTVQQSIPWTCWALFEKLYKHTTKIEINAGPCLLCYHTTHTHHTRWVLTTAFYL